MLRQWNTATATTQLEAIPPTQLTEVAAAVGMYIEHRMRMRTSCMRTASMQVHIYQAHVHELLWPWHYKC